MSERDSIPWSFVPVPDWALSVPGVPLGELLVLGCIVARYDHGRGEAAVGMRSIGTRISRDRNQVRASFRALVRRGWVRVLGTTAEGYQRVSLHPPGRGAHLPGGGVLTSPGEGVSTPRGVPGVLSTPHKKDPARARAGGRAVARPPRETDPDAGWVHDASESAEPMALERSGVGP